MSTVISRERPDATVAKELIAELDAHLNALYPVESRNGLSVTQLIQEDVAFFVLFHDGLPAGCGGIQLFGTEYGEVKRMYVRPAFRGRGLGKRLLEHLIQYTRSRGVDTLRLETGEHQQEAIGLYERAGFVGVPPFGRYRQAPFCRWYEKRLPPS